MIHLNNFDGNLKLRNVPDSVAMTRGVTQIPLHIILTPSQEYVLCLIRHNLPHQATLVELTSAGSTSVEVTCEFTLVEFTLVGLTMVEYTLVEFTLVNYFGNLLW